MTRLLTKTALIGSAAILLIAASPKADLNQDGQVTKAEFMESAQTHFAETDTNGDGFVTEDERTAHRAARFEDKKNEIFAKLDANGDGSVSRDEMDAIGERMTARKDKWKAKKLERYDTNLDGELNDSERTIMDAERDAKKAERRADGGERRGRKGGKRGQRPNPDANGDGFVSLDEHMAISEQLFTRLDANADGVLTKGEGRKRRGRRGGRHGG